jgi:hypothetical protein
MEAEQSPIQAAFDFPTPPTAVEPFRKIRIETVLSKFPIHTLSKTGKVDICITDTGEHGERKLLWKVTPNAAYGEPRALAYKLDTLVINRTLDEIGRPLPELIRLGSLRDIAKVLGLGGNTNDVKRALRQNAHAVIAAKLQYTDTERKQREFEFETTRYGVIFSGETLPTGSRADAVYITLNPTYRSILNSAPLRPLDYNYLKDLPPASQRFYEVISYRVFAALSHAGGKTEPVVRIRYSDYCTFSAQKRSFNWNNVRPQMSEVHKPHLQSGYLKSVHYEKRVDGVGNPDWMMSYEIGPKAKAEFSVFTKKERAAAAEAELLPLPPVPLAPPAADPDNALPIIEAPKIDTALLKELTSRGISRKKATELLSKLQPEQQVVDQLEWGDDLIRRAAPGTFRNPPGLLISFIEMNLTPPSYFETSRTTKLRESARLQAAEEHMRKLQLENAYEDYKRERVEQYIDEELDPEEYQTLYTAHKKEVASKYKSLQLNPMSIAEIAHGSVRTEIMARIPVLTFEEFSKEQNIL